jgi:hypothetical protein
MAEHYVAYMLRLWRASDDEQVVWRASLEHPHTGERSAFASLEALFAFLQTATGPQLPPDEPTGALAAPPRPKDD